MPTPLTRRFLSGQPIGGGRQQPIRGNSSSGIGMNDQFVPKNPLAPLAPTPSTGLQRTTTAAMAPVATKSMTPISRPGGIGSPNRGGSITRNGITTNYRPSAGQNTSPSRPNKGGTMTRQLAPDVKAVTVVPPSPAAIRAPLAPALSANQPAAIQPALDTPGTPVASPTTTAAPQTESNNPLTGDGNEESEGTTDALDAGSALGLNRRGTQVPKGTDAAPGQNVGGSGLYARQFPNPKSAGIYDSYVRKIFGGGQV